MSLVPERFRPVLSFPSLKRHQPGIKANLLDEVIRLNAYRKGLSDVTLIVADPDKPHLILMGECLSLEQKRIGPVIAAPNLIRTNSGEVIYNSFGCLLMRQITNTTNIETSPIRPLRPKGQSRHQFTGCSADLNTFMSGLDISLVQLIDCNA